MYKYVKIRAQVLEPRGLYSVHACVHARTRVCVRAIGRASVGVGGIWELQNCQTLEQMGFNKT